MHISRKHQRIVIGMIDGFGTDYLAAQPLPAAAARIARTSSLPAACFCTYPLAPASSASRTNARSSSIVKTTTDVLGEIGPSLRIAAMLEPPGMFRSRTSTSGR